MGTLFGKKPEGPPGLKGSAAYIAELEERKKNLAVTPMSRDYRLGLKKSVKDKERR